MSKQRTKVDLSALFMPRQPAMSKEEAVSLFLPPGYAAGMRLRSARLRRPRSWSLDFPPGDVEEVLPASILAVARQKRWTRL